MKKKNNFIFFIIFLVLVAVIIGFRAFSSNNYVDLEPYQKYRLLISIDTFYDDENRSYKINIMDDGTNAKIYSNIEDFDGFLLGNELSYAYQDVIYSIDLKRNYRNLNKILGDLKKADLIEEKEDGTARYSQSLSSGIVNKILDALGIEKDTKESAILKFVMNDRHISSANLTVSDLEGYNKIEIMMTFKELSEDFIVNTDVLTNNQRRLYKRKVMSENPLSIVR